MPDKFTRLGDLADIGLGFKSLQNDFFYVSAETISTFGIEPQFVEPILTLKDLDTSRFLQTVTPILFVFSCGLPLHDIRGTGALKYIRAMAKRAAKQRKQSAKAKTIEEALGAQGGSLWYAPKATRHPSRLWLRKAFDATYAPFLFDSPAVMDQRCNFLLPKSGITCEELAAVLTSTVFAYSLEINGAFSMGGGALEAATTLVQEVPAPDIRLFAAKSRKKIVELAKMVWETEPPVDFFASSKVGTALRELDSFILQELSTTVAIETLYKDIRYACQARKGLAKDKVGKTKKKKSDSIDSVGQSVISSVRPLLESQHFPESYIPKGAQSLDLDFGGLQVSTIELHPLMQEAEVTMLSKDGMLQYSAILPYSVAHLLVRAFLLGRRQFHVVADEENARKGLDESLPWLAQIMEKLKVALAASAAGTGYENEVLSNVLHQLGVSRVVFEKVLPTRIEL